MKTMRSKTANWYECSIRYEKMMEDGKQKKVTEKYVVDAVSWGNAETMITEEMSAYISGEMTIPDISRPSYGEIFFSEKDGDDKWYKVKLAFITINEKTQKEVKTRVYYLVQGHSVENARKNVIEVMETSMIDYEIKGIVETKIMDVFEYKSKPTHS